MIYFSMTDPLKLKQDGWDMAVLLLFFLLFLSGWWGEWCRGGWLLFNQLVSFVSSNIIKFIETLPVFNNNFHPLCMLCCYDPVRAVLYSLHYLLREVLETASWGDWYRKQLCQNSVYHGSSHLSCNSGLYVYLLSVVSLSIIISDIRQWHVVYRERCIRKSTETSKVKT